MKVETATKYKSDNFYVVGSDNSYRMRSVLAQRLEEGRIMGVEFDCDVQEFNFAEECDGCFSRSMTINEFSEWIEELNLFLKMMKNKIEVKK